jgi:hypothetical protein
MPLAAGYFDADGNYIEYKLEQLKDAWLDTIEVRNLLWGLCTVTILPCLLLAAQHTDRIQY